jgi:hypothetical protein
LVSSLCRLFKRRDNGGPYNLLVVVIFFLDWDQGNGLVIKVTLAMVREVLGLISLFSYSVGREWMDWGFASLDRQ